MKPIRDSVAFRAAAAEKYRPRKIKLLIVGEAPPCSGDRYFYFEEVESHDGLFMYICKGLWGAKPERKDKPAALAKLRDSGVFLTDIIAETVSKPKVGELLPHAPALVERCKAWKPERIVLVKASVYDAAYASLKAAGLPVIDERIPFPGSGQQTKFEVGFARAIG